MLIGVSDLAAALRNVQNSATLILEGTPPPFDQEYFLWHIQILPRLTKRAGFEMGSGMSIDTVVPEEATAPLRQTLIRWGVKKCDSQD